MPRPRTIGRQLLLVGALALVGAAIAFLAFRTRVQTSLSTGAFHRYNVLFVTIDTLRPDRLGCYGSKAGLTPALDRLAAEGVRFTTVRAHAPLTLPSHVSI